MAHKHNRRRMRPRSRAGKGQSLDSPSSFAFPFEASSSGLSTPSAPRQLQTYPPLLLSSNNDVAVRHWRNRYLAWQNREFAQQREAARLEVEQLKIFGGEPGDDVGLCYKMMEVFDGMDWINT